MKKTRELIQDNMKMVDAVIEVIDARIPVSSRNPIIDELVSSKPRIIAINKSDLAEDSEHHNIDEETPGLLFSMAKNSGGMIHVSALSGEGIDEIKNRIAILQPQ